MLDPELRELCIKLRPLIGSRADKLWYLYTTAENLNLRTETEGIIRAIANKELGHRVDQQTVLLPPPPLSASKGNLRLGRLLYAGSPQHEISLLYRDISSHIAMIGTTGSGKSTAALGLLQECIKAKLPFMVIDWKRAYRNLHNIDASIKVFTIGRSASPFHWNALVPPPGTSQLTWIKIVGEVLQRSHVGGDGVGLILMEAVEALENRFEAGSDYRMNFLDLKNYLGTIKVTGRKALWHQSAERVLKALTYEQTATQCINARNPVEIPKLLHSPVILELDMGLPADLRIFLSEILFRWLHLYRLSQGETQHTRHLLVLEEAHNLLESNSYKHDAHNHLQTLMRELRGFGQGVCILTQTVANLPQWLVGNLNTLIFFQLSHEADILAAKRALFLKPKEEIYLDRLKTGEALIKIKSRTSNCHVVFSDLPPQLKRNVSDEVISQ